MILAHQQIKEAYQRGDIVISPFDESQIEAASYDLRVGEQGATTTTRKLVNIKENGYILIEPGDFGVVICLEEIKLGPQYAGRIGLRSKFARKGLIATTGPQIDPGYHGRLIIGITNLTPQRVSLSYGEGFITIEFHRLEQATIKPYAGPYQDKLKLGPDEIAFIVEQESMALSEVIKTLQSLSANVGKLVSEVNILKYSIPVIVTIGIAVIGIIVALK